METTQALSPPRMANLAVHPRVEPSRPVVRSTRPRKARRWLRTREIERLQVQNLHLDIIALQSEIHRMQVARSLLQARALNRQEDRDGYYFKIMREYFRVLRHGIRGINHDQASERLFLNAILDHDVKKGRLRGIDQFVTMLGRYTEAFGPVIHELVAVDVQVGRPGDGSGDLIALRVTSRYQTSIVQRTFDIIFPHAPQALRDEIMGRRVSGKGIFDVLFDARSRRVVSFDMDFDFIAVFARLLPDPSKLTRLFHGALVTPDCCIGDLSGFHFAEQSSPKTSPSRNLTIRQLLNGV